MDEIRRLGTIATLVPSTGLGAAPVRRLGVPSILLCLLVLTVPLSGCFATDGRTGPATDANLLADYTGCSFAVPGSDLETVDCESTLSYVPVRSTVPAGWVCVDSNAGSEDPGHEYAVYHHPDRERVGFWFSNPHDADVYTGWASLAVEGRTRGYNYTTDRDTGFVVFDESTVGQNEEFSVEFQYARVSYTANRTELEDGEKRPFWIPSKEVDGKTPRYPYWLVHRFDHGNRSYFFSTLDPVNVTYDKTDFRLTIEPHYHLFRQDGYTAPVSYSAGGADCPMTDTGVPRPGGSPPAAPTGPLSPVSRS